MADIMFSYRNVNVSWFLLNVLEQNIPGISRQISDILKQTYIMADIIYSLTYHGWYVIFISWRISDVPYHNLYHDISTVLSQNIYHSWYQMFSNRTSIMADIGCMATHHESLMINNDIHSLNSLPKILCS